MEIPPWVNQLFQSIDAGDADAFAAFLSEDAEFRYGSQPSVRGRDAVRGHVAGFFAGLTGLSHELRGFWWGDPGRVCFVQGLVVYTLPGGGPVSLPFLNLFRMDGDRIGQYLVYTDPSPLIS
jgi:ketosteroid isomerase-like protein